MKESATPGLPVPRSPEPSNMPKTPHAFDFRKPVAYDLEAKRAFHNRARRQLKLLADALGLAPGSYDIRSNAGGIAVSGEVTMHSAHLYVQACQPASGHDSGILFRTCRGRKDYYGGPNNFAPLDLLNRPRELACRINQVCLPDEAAVSDGGAR
jgi:hypothetical protein